MPPEKETDTEPLPITEMGQPPPDLTPDGRVNPAGIPCFYAALESETAIAELRPWPHARITVATFDTAGAFNVLDLRNSNPRVREVRSVYWAAFMISRPVHRDDRFGYLGTQYLAERLKAAGTIGLLYASTLRPGGTNVALFSDSGLKPTVTTFHEVMDVAYKTALLTPRPNVAKTLTELLEPFK
jgi:RES domain-containing protein